MPQLVWKSEEDKFSQWKFAKNQLAEKLSITQLKRADDRGPILYVIRNNGAINLAFFCKN